MPSTKKIFVVLGATGAQGGPVARYLLQKSSHLFHVRAITRDPSKLASQELAKLGAEVIQANFSDERSIRAAFAGAHVIFAITNFWDQYSVDIEVAQGKLINLAASEVSTLEHYVFSSLPEGRNLDGGRFQNILPYNSKAMIREDLARYEALQKRTTEVWVAFYWQNWIKYPVFAPVKVGDEWVLSMPYPATTRVPSSSSDDCGIVVDAIVKGGEKYYGKVVTVMSRLLSEGEKLKIWGKDLGLKARFEKISLEEREKSLQVAGLPPDLALATAELLGALPFEEEVITAHNIIQASDIIPKDYELKSWADYVKEADWTPLIK